jgi:hypothetical protein
MFLKDSCTDIADTPQGSPGRGPPGVKEFKPTLIPYPGFRYTLLVPTVKWVHFLYLKPSVCILFLQELYRMSVLKIWYLHILGFRYR